MTINSYVKSLKLFSLDRKKRNTTINSSGNKVVEQWNAFDRVILEEIDKKFLNKPLLQRHQTHNRLLIKDSPSIIKFQNSLLNSLNNNYEVIASQGITKHRSNISLPVIDSNANANTVLITKSLIDDQEKAKEKESRNSSNNILENLPHVRKLNCYYKLFNSRHGNDLICRSTKESSLKMVLNRKEKKTNQSYSSIHELIKQSPAQERETISLQPLMKKIVIQKINDQYKRVSICKSQDDTSEYKIADCDYSILSKNGVITNIKKHYKN